MNFRDELQLAIGEVALDAIGGPGATVSYVHRDKTAISLTVVPGAESTDLADSSGLESEQYGRSFYVPCQAGLVAEVTTKALTSNVATITTKAAHGFVAGQLVRVRLTTADTTFDGEHIIVAAPTTTTFTFAKTHANVTSAAATGVVDGVINIGDRIVFESAYYEINQCVADSVRAGYMLSCIRVKPKRSGV